MYGVKRGWCFNAQAIVLIIISVISIALSFININNLFNDSVFLDLASFRYKGPIGVAPLYCQDMTFLAFAWTCGLLSVTALITGIMALGVKEMLNFYNLVFLFISGITAFFTSIVIVVCSSMVLRCHVSLTGQIPAANLLISIFAVFQCILSFLAFFKVIRKRWEMTSDLKYGIEPIPDPFELTVNPENVVIVRGDYPELHDIDPYNSKDDFFKAMSKTGGHFSTPYARSNVLTNPTKFKLPNYPTNNFYENNAVTNTPLYTNESRVVPSGVRRDGGGWVSNAGMGGGVINRGMGGAKIGGAVVTGGGGWLPSHKATKYAGCPEEAYTPYSRPILEYGDFA